MKKVLADFGSLSLAEGKLAREVHTGLLVVISSGTPPENAPKALRIRASFLRYLALGGCEACTPDAKGVLVQGAFIEGDGDPRGDTIGLDLEGATLPGDLALIECRIPGLILMRSAAVKSVFLNDSWLGQGLSADRLEAKGDVVLDGAQVEGELRLLGASLGGDLDCDGARLTAGAIGKALNAVGLQVTGAFFCRVGTSATGILDLTKAHVGLLVDDPACWPTAGDLILDGFTYDSIAGVGPTDAKTRLDWLARQRPERFGDDFWPQPYEQLASVLRKMGHRADAKTVLIEKERLQRQARRRRLWKDHLYEDAYWASLWDRLLGVTVCYGQAPLLALAWLAGFWLFGALVFGDVAASGALKPNNAFVLRAPEWVLCAAEATEKVKLIGRDSEQMGRAATGQSQYACFLDQPEAKAYPRFNAAIYSADTLLPVVDLEMQEFWIPDERHTSARAYLWVQIIVGWGLSLLAVAGFSGLIKSD